MVTSALLSCVVCERKKETGGYNDTEFIHCNKCHALWTGLGRTHCTLCHQTFNSYGGSDRHWTIDGHMHPLNLSYFDFRSGIWFLKMENESWAEKVFGGVERMGARETEGICIEPEGNVRSSS